MAFPEDSDYGRPREVKSHSKSITEYETSALFALLLQFGTAIMTLTAFGPTLALIPLLISEMPATGPVNPIGFYSIIVLVPVGLVQLYAAYSLYKRNPSCIMHSWISDLIALTLYCALFISSIMTDTLSSVQMFVAYIGINLVLVVLLRMPEVIHTYEKPSEYSNY